MGTNKGKRQRTAAESKRFFTLYSFFKIIYFKSYLEKVSRADK